MNTLRNPFFWYGLAWLASMALVTWMHFHPSVFHECDPKTGKCYTVTISN